MVVPTSGPPAVPVLAGVPYEGTVRRLVVQWKDGGRADLTPWLAQVLAAVVARRVSEVLPVAVAALPSVHPGTTLWLVPAPSSASARRARGEDLVARLARDAASLVRAGTGVGLGVAPVLRQRRGVADQAGLGVRERRSNMEGRIVVARWRDPPPIALVVDDVVTSGATAAAAVAALRAAGTAVLGVCSVSATPARRPLSVGRMLR
jgi:predicted amidophosphoribosyltransferase